MNSLVFFLAQTGTARRGSGRLLGIGFMCSCAGVYLLKKWWDHDTLVPGTNFTHIPRWLLLAGGLLMQIPLPGIWFWLRSIGHFGGAGV